MSKRTLIAIALVVMTVSVVGAASYTSATVDRETNIELSTDDSAVVGLEPGSVSGIGTNGAGELVMNLDNSAGLNTNAEFVYGDTNDAQNAYAFSVTNNDGANHVFDFSYSFDAGSDPDGSNDNVEFHIYDSSGTAISGSPATESASASTTINSGNTYYVVIVVDTTDLDATVGDDLSGTLTISAS